MKNNLFTISYYLLYTSGMVNLKIKLRSSKLHEIFVKYIFEVLIRPRRGHPNIVNPGQLLSWMLLRQFRCITVLYCHSGKIRKGL